MHVVYKAIFSPERFGVVAISDFGCFGITKKRLPLVLEVYNIRI